MHALLILGSFLVSATDDATRTDKGRLEGMWSLVSTAEDGNRPILGSNTTLTLRDGKFTVYILPKAKHVDSPGTCIYSLYTTDATKTPGTMDITPLSGPNKGKTSRAIYVVAGDQLTICQTTIPNKARPTGFVSKRGTVLQTFKRQ
jgi:uncharacterized protein (TIGR03067 family)